MGRRGIELKKIENKSRRQTTFTKRRNGLFKKANEICSKCDAEVGVITFSEAGNAFTFGHPSVDSTVDRFLARTTSSSSNNANWLADDRVKELEGKYNEAVARLEAEKKRGEIMEKAKQVVHGGKPLWDAPIEDLGLHEVEQYKATLEEMKDKLESRIIKEIMIRNVPSVSFVNSSIVPHGYSYDSGLYKYSL